MAKHTLKAGLSVSEIRQLQKDLMRYQEYLTNKAAQLAKRLSEIGVDIAQVQIANLDAIFTGELIASVYSKYGDSTKGGAIFYIVADSSHAAFVEFGTLGSIGGKKEYPYPLPEGVKWDYGSGSNIIQNSKGQYGWFYKGDDGNVYWCEGMDSRPFFHNTSLELYTKVEETAKKIFGNKE